MEKIHEISVWKTYFLIAQKLLEDSSCACLHIIYGHTFSVIIWLWVTFITGVKQPWRVVEDGVCTYSIF